METSCCFCFTTTRNTKGRSATKKNKKGIKKDASDLLDHQRNGGHENLLNTHATFEDAPSFLKTSSAMGGSRIILDSR